MVLEKVEVYMTLFSVYMVILKEVIGVGFLKVIFVLVFDNLSYDFILEKIKRFPIRNLVERFLKAGYVDNNVFL